VQQAGKVKPGQDGTGPLKSTPRPKKPKPLIDPKCKLTAKKKRTKKEKEKKFREHRRFGH